jgi:hypothetical protein
MVSCALAQPAPSSDDESDEGVPPPISLPTPGDPNIPDALDRRLAYAQSLVESKDGDCAARLDDAQTQRDIAASDPALDIVIGGGQARLANIDYRLHLGRAYCGSEAQPRKDELLAALDAALRAVSLYRDRYAYQAMVVMQYNVAVIQHRLGDQSKAMAALETAIGMDQDYGFATDAGENAGLLRRWKGQPAASDAVPPLKRSITLKFAWAPVDADVSIQADYADLIGKAVVHSAANTSLVRHIRPDQEDWIVSSDVADRHYEFADWSDHASPSLERTTVMLAAERMWSATLRIGASGDYKGVVDAGKTAGVLGGDIDLVTDDLKPASEGKLDLTASLGRTVQLLARPDGLAARAAEDYTLGTAAWIGATLEQGVWYDMTASLFLPGMVILVDHDIQFAYSRPVTCTNGANEAACVEILVHATPNPDALRSKLTDVRQALRVRGDVRYASSTDLRLVVDPARLLPYVSEARRHWYIAIDGKGDPLIGSETVVSTYSYR